MKRGRGRSGPSPVGVRVVDAAGAAPTVIAPAAFATAVFAVRGSSRTMATARRAPPRFVRFIPLPFVCLPCSTDERHGGIPCGNAILILYRAYGDVRRWPCCATGWLRLSGLLGVIR